MATVPVYAASKNTANVTSTSKNAIVKSRKDGIKGVTGVTTGSGTMELTSQECKGLGGKVTAPTPDMKCGAFDACATTDQHGVIRLTCIDEVAAD